VLAHTVVYNPLEIPVGVSLLAIAVYQCHLHWLTRRYREQAHSYRKADLYFGWGFWRLTDAGVARAGRSDSRASEKKL